MMRRIDLPHIRVPDDMPPDQMPDLLRYWYLGSKARHHMMLRRFSEVDVEISTTGPHLDIGSAWGYNVLALTKLGIPATGMDLVVDQFAAGKRIASANGLDLEVVGADAAKLPFADESFSSISMVETLEHIFEADRDRVFAECRRVLTGGGRLILSTPNHGSLIERAKRLIIRLPWLRRRLPTMCYPTWEVARGDYHPYRYHHPWPAKTITARLEAAGYDVSRTKYFLFVFKSASDWIVPALVPLEAVLERIPLLRRLAATLCVVAVKR